MNQDHKAIPREGTIQAHRVSMPDTDQLIACGYTWYSATCETCGQTVNFVGSEFTHEEEPEKVAVGVRRNWSQLFDKTCP